MGAETDLDKKMRKQVCLFQDCDVPVSAAGNEFSKDVVAFHYQSEHGISVFNDCKECGSKFAALIDPHRKIYRSYCPECCEDNDLRELVVRVDGDME